jgi:predicted ATPase/DNA-binding CsgD family transcriptional regulator
MTTEILLSAGNLPAEPNSFVGRERDLAELGMLLGDVRALTLCGPGGIGKTRLALRLAAELAPEFPDGAWIAELADVDDAELVARRVAATLGIREEPDRPLSETLTEALRSRRLLLILDTCEHVVDAGAALVQQLLAGCRWVRVIATSREPLRVRGETVWRVPPLELPATLDVLPAAELAGHEAVRLFTDRAAAVRPGFALTPLNAQAVVRLCRMLDGIPLAIELAAARIRALSVEQVATRLSDRFQLLASGDRTAPVRQQTLRAAVDWSYELLTGAEQALLRRLSVFSGWNLEMAEQVCADEALLPRGDTAHPGDTPGPDGPNPPAPPGSGRVPADDVLDLLAALIDKSLVSLDGELSGDARYRLLDTIREYAAYRLAASGEQDTIRAAHRDYLIALGEGIVAQAFLRGDPPWPARVAMYLRVDVERPNFRSALSECLARGDAERGLGLCIGLRSPWVAYGDVSEGVVWFDRFLALDTEVTHGTRARALVHRGELAYEQQDYATAARSAQAGLDLLGSPQEPGGSAALRVLALVSMQMRRLTDALEQADAAVAAARGAGDYWEEGLALGSRAVIIARLGQLGEAEAAFQTALKALRDNNGWGIAQTLYGFGSLARARGENDAAIAHFRDALALYREIDARPEIARCLAGIGWVAMAQLDLELAAASLTESIQVSLATGQRLAIARGIEAFAALALLEDDLERAVTLAGAGSELRAGGHGLSASARARLDAQLDTARQKLGRSVSDALLAEGAAMTAYEAVAYALGMHRGETAANGAAAPPRPGRPADGAARAGEANGGAGAGPAPGRGGVNGMSRAAAPGRARSGSLPGPNAGGVLTGRELEIARLIARGLSNRGIADELTISPATAARHVANIFGKLGFTSRAQVAAWTAERGPDA